MTVTSQCAFCRHFIGRKGNRPVCNAFPNGIPQVILHNEFDHRKPYLGDDGIHFEQSEESLQTLGVIHLFEEEEESAPTLAKAS
jgi:hypothetical protein